MSQNEIETFSVSCNICKFGRDYELEAIIEAINSKTAAKIFVSDWIETIFSSILSTKDNNLIIAVSHYSGYVEYFIIKNNFITKYD